MGSVAPSARANAESPENLAMDLDQLTNEVSKLTTADTARPKRDLRMYAVLPAELTHTILLNIDLETALLSRQVSRGWKFMIDCHEPTWRRYGAHLRLIPDEASPLPGKAQQGARKPSNDRQCDEAWTSLTGHFQQCASYRQLCDSYRRLSSSWRTNRSILEPCHSRSPKIWWYGALFKIEGLFNGPMGMCLGHQMGFSFDPRPPIRLEMPFWRGYSGKNDQVMLLHGNFLLKCRKHRETAVVIVDEARFTRSDGHVAFNTHWNLADANHIEACCYGCFHHSHVRNRDYEAFQAQAPYADGFTRRGTIQLFYTLAFAETVSITRASYPSLVSRDMGVFQARGRRLGLFKRADCADLPFSQSLYFCAWQLGFRVYLASSRQLTDEVVTEVFALRQGFSPEDTGSVETDVDSKIDLAIGIIQRQQGSERSINSSARISWSTLTPDPSRYLSDPTTYREAASGGLVNVLRTKLYDVARADWGDIHSIGADTRTQTLVVAYHWGLLLCRPFSAFLPSSSARLSLGMIVYFNTRDSVSPDGNLIARWSRGLAVFDGRVCHSIEHGVPLDGDEVTTTVFLTDLDPNRMHATADASEQPLDRCTTRILSEEEVPPIHLARNEPYRFVVTDIAMDATGVYLREPTQLKYFEFGLAVDHA
ncbi:F-box domain [Ceraceosorus bombacis]|uniref:F-box domain n=1 Tax=Ceraceosorus bombacis TaxID=401625 RepID=A0A0P1BGI6_9BASI|nr:F-box domain [Ceraceosorus bombacis]